MTLSLTPCLMLTFFLYIDLIFFTSSSILKFMSPIIIKLSYIFTILSVVLLKSSEKILSRMFGVKTPKNNHFCKKCGKICNFVCGLSDCHNVIAIEVKCERSNSRPKYSKCRSFKNVDEQNLLCYLDSLKSPSKLHFLHHLAY
jgi:hypothetical protein